MDNPEKLATWGTQEEENKTKTQDMCWTPLYVNNVNKKNNTKNKTNNRTTTASRYFKKQSSDEIYNCVIQSLFFMKRLCMF